MAYKIVGYVYKVGAVEEKTSKGGDKFNRRPLTLMVKRFDSSTGKEFDPYYPTFDFSRGHVADLDNLKKGDRVEVSFEVVGTKYNDRNTGEEKFFTALRGFGLELLGNAVQASAPNEQVNKANDGLPF
jgi:hypothetical protein